MVLDSIRKDSQRLLADNGTNFILWGILVIVSWLLTYIVQSYGISDHLGWLYLLIFGSGWVYMAYSSRREAKRETGNPLVIKLTAAIWLSVLGSASLVALFGAVTETIDLNRLASVIFTILGIAYYLQGVLAGTKWVSALAFGWWGGSILLYFISGLWAGIVSSLMMLALQIIPGIIFNLQWKTQFNKELH